MRTCLARTVSGPAIAVTAAAMLATAAAVAIPPAGAARKPCQAPSARSARAARTVVRRFVAWAVLRRDPLRARSLVTPELAAGTTRRDWRRGLIPVVPFVARGRLRTNFGVDASCRRNIALGVGLRALDEGEPPALFNLEEVRRGDRWLVDYWGPPGIRPPSG